MSTQQPVEMILLRQLASYLTIPIWMMDASGNLLFYNDSAGDLVGASFDDVGPVTAEDLPTMFETSVLDGTDTDVPVVRVFASHRPAHGQIRFRGLNGVSKAVEVAAIPIEGQAGRFLGVLAVFWEIAE